MKVAYIISEKENLVVGDCLSSAKMFYVFDQSIASYFDLALPDQMEKHQLAILLSEFLKKNDIDMVVGTDIGPKAKSALEEHDIQWYIANENDSIEKINNAIKNKK